MYNSFQPTFPPPPAHAPLSVVLTLLAPVVLFGAGIGLWLWVRRRQFYRTNPAGVEEFKNFRSAVFAGMVEWAALYAGFLLNVAGVVSLLLVFGLFI